MSRILLAIKVCQSEGRAAKNQEESLFQNLFKVTLQKGMRGGGIGTKSFINSYHGPHVGRFVFIVSLVGFSIFKPEDADFWVTVFPEKFG